MDTNENDNTVNENNEENNSPQQSIFDEMREKLYQRRASVSQENSDQTPFSSNPFIARTQREEAELNQWGLDELDNIFDRQLVQFHANMRIIDEKITDDAEKQRVYDEVKEQYKEYLAYREQTKPVIKETASQTEKRPSVRERAYRNLDEASPEVGKRMRDSHAETLWKKTLKRLQEEVSPAIFHTWLESTEGASYQDDVLIVHATTPFAKTQLEGRFIEQIRAIVSDIDKAVLDVRLEHNTSLSSTEDNDTSMPPVEIIEDITQHPEYIKGYQKCIERNKEQDEQDKSPYRQGWHVASDEIMRNKVRLATNTEKEQSDTSWFSDLMENNAIKKLQEEVKKLDERLKKLEKYTEE